MSAFAAMLSGSGAFLTRSQIIAAPLRTAADAARLTSTPPQRSVYRAAARMTSSSTVTKNIVFGGGCFW